MSRGGTTLYVTVCAPPPPPHSTSLPDIYIKASPCNMKDILTFFYRVSDLASVLAILPTNSNGMSAKNRYLDDHPWLRWSISPSSSILVLHPRPSSVETSLSLSSPACRIYYPLSPNPPRSIERSHNDTSTLSSHICLARKVRIAADRLVFTIHVLYISYFHPYICPRSPSEMVQGV